MADGGTPFPLHWEEKQGRIRGFCPHCRRTAQQTEIAWLRTQPGKRAILLRRGYRRRENELSWIAPRCGHPDEPREPDPDVSTWCPDPEEWPELQGRFARLSLTELRQALVRRWQTPLIDVEPLLPKPWMFRRSGGALFPNSDGTWTEMPGLPPDPDGVVRRSQESLRRVARFTLPCWQCAQLVRIGKGVFALWPEGRYP